MVMFEKEFSHSFDLVAQLLTVSEISNAHLKSLLHIYEEVYFCKVAGCKPF